MPCSLIVTTVVTWRSVAVAVTSRPEPATLEVQPAAVPATQAVALSPAPAPVKGTDDPVRSESMPVAAATETAPAAANQSPAQPAAATDGNVSEPVAATWLVSATLGAYLLGVALMLLRLAVALWGGWKLRIGSQPIQTAALREALERQARALGLRFVPVLAYCERVAVPTVVGILKPTILLPLSLMSGLSAEQVEAILAHELAHIRRYDHLVNLLQRMIESLLFFHPAVWWVSNRVRAEREHCCDDLAIACGAVPLEYAASLLKVAELSRVSGLRAGPAMGLSATGRVSSLRQRISRLLGDPAAPQMRLAHSVSVFALGAASCLLAWAATSFFWEKFALAEDRPQQSPMMVLWTAAVTDEVLDELRWLHLSKNRPVEAGSRMALMKPISVNIVDHSVEEVVALLKKQHGVSIRIDAEALRNAGINSAVRDQNFVLSDIQLSSVLKLMLTPKKLSYVLDESGITITTADKGKVPDDLLVAPKGAKLAAAKPENELERLFCSAEELRKVINRVRTDPLDVKIGSEVKSYSLRPHFSPEDHWHTHHFENLYVAERYTPLDWNGSGMLTLTPGATESKLDFKGYMTFEVGRESTMKRADFDVKERLKPSEVVAYIIPSPAKKGWQPSLLVMCEMLSVPTSDLKHVDRLISQQNFVQLGPTEIKERAARAVAWKARDHRHLSELNPKWTRDLPHGGHLQLVAISRPKRAPLIWWTPDGEPIGGININCISDQEMIAIVRVWEDVQRRTRVLPPNTTEGWIPDYGDEDRKAEMALTAKLGSQLEMLPAQLAGPSGEPLVKIGLGTGPWTAEAKISRVRDSTVKFQGTTFRMSSVFPSHLDLEKKPRSAASFFWEPSRDFDFTAVAVSKSGEQFPTFNPPIVVGNDPKNTVNYGEVFSHFVDDKEVSHYLIKSRTAQWVEFKGFATRPKIPLPGLAPQQGLTAKLPTGLVVELAGVTKNMASARDGWRPDGQPIGDLEEWPAGLVISKNRIGRTHDLKKFPPLPDAVDYLLQFSGIREPFAYRFFGPGTHSHVPPPLKDVGRFRLSSGHHKSKDQATLSMVLTDAPWGKYQRLSGDGTLLNQIEKADLYSSYYRSIRILKAGEVKQPEHLLPAPQVIIRRTKDWINDYEFELRAIDKQGKSHSAMMWLERYPDGPDMAESFWRADRELFPKDFEYFEFRLRPYRYRVTFANVALHSGLATQPQVSVEAIEDPNLDNKGVTNKRIIPWLRALADGTTNEKAQAAYEIERWIEETRPEAIDPRLTKALVRRLGSHDAGTGPSPTGGRVIKPLDDWITGALSRIGRPAAEELIALIKDETSGRRLAAVDALGQLKSVGPEGVDILIGLLEDRGPELNNRASYALQKLTDEPTLIPKLIAASEQSPLTTRSRAIGVLGLFPGEAVDNALRKALTDSDRQIHLWVLFALGRHPRPQLSRDLFPLLKSPSQEIRATAATRLADHAGESVKTLLLGATSGSPEVRAACLQAMFRVPDGATSLLVPVVMNALQDDSPEVRKSALHFVGSRAGWFKRRAVPDAIVANIQHADEGVQKAAIGLARSGLPVWGKDPRLIPHLLRLLETSNWSVAHYVIGTLGAYQAVEALPQLIRRAELYVPKAAARDSMTPPVLAEAFVSIGDPRAIPVLKKMAQAGYPDAIIALATFRDREMVPVLLELLSSPELEVRCAVARAFERTPDPLATPVLTAALLKEVPEKPDGVGRFPNPQLVYALGRAMGHSGEVQAIRALVSRIDGADPGGNSWQGQGVAEEVVKTRIANHLFTTPLMIAGPVALPELAKGLGAKSETTRRVCAYVLSQSYVNREPIPNDTPEFRADMIKALNDKDHFVQFWIFEAVSRQRIAEAEPVLISLVEKREAGLGVRIRAMTALSWFKSDRAFEAALKALDDPDYLIRIPAVDQLRKYPGERTASRLLKAINDSQIDTNVADALGIVGDSRAIAPLLQILKGRVDVNAQAAAARALGLLGGTVARAELRDVLERVPADVAEAQAYDRQLAAAVSLAQLQDEAGTRRLRQVMSSQNKRLYLVMMAVNNAHVFGRNRETGKFLHEPTRALFREVIEAEQPTTLSLRSTLLEILAENLDEPTRKLLERFVGEPQSDLHRKAIAILVAADPQKYAELLRKLLEARTTQDRHNLIPLLSKFYDNETTRQLVALSADPDVRIRLAAVRAMEAHLDAGMLARLQELTRDPHEQVRTLARHILSARRVPIAK